MLTILFHLPLFLLFKEFLKFFLYFLVAFSVSSKVSLFFYLYLNIIPQRSLQLSEEQLHFSCRTKNLLNGLCSIEDSLLDSTTLELESSCFLFLVDFMSLSFLVAAEEILLSSLDSKFYSLVPKKSVISLRVECTNNGYDFICRYRYNFLIFCIRQKLF